jgi:MFS family permease
VFVVIEQRRNYPMFDLSLFTNRVFIGASIPPLTLSIAFWGVFLYFPLYYQAALGYSPLLAGAAVLPFAIPLFVMGPVGGWLAARMPSHLLLSLGQTLVGIGSFLLLVGTVDSAWPAFVLGGLVSGTGTGLINGELSNVAMSIVPAERSGMASGISGTMRQVGVALGFAGLGAILAHRTALAFSRLAADLNLPTHQVASVTARVVKGDIAGAMATLPDASQHAFQVAAKTSLFEGFRLIILVAGVVGITGALLTFTLMRPSKTDSS